MNPDAIALLSAIATCHGKLREHAIRLRERPTVREVTHACNMPALDGAFRVEEFVDAELVSGEAISWFLEVTVAPNGVAVEADVRRIHSEGQDLVTGIAEDTYTLGESVRQLPEITQRLCSAGYGLTGEPTSQL